MFDAVLWGLVQGLTEFLPISSSGHLVLVPALLDREAPDLALSAVLHLGTLAAVLAYFRRDIAGLLRFRRDPQARRTIGLLVLGTVPAAVLGLTFESILDDVNEHPAVVAGALIGTGLLLLGARRLQLRSRRFEEAGVRDALAVGVFQAFALMPGFSRSGFTITAAEARGFAPVEAARFSFLLGIPAIAGAGFLEALDLADAGGLSAEVWVGMAVAALSGYAAIAILLALLRRIGLTPFAVYCLVAGIVALIVV